MSDFVALPYLVTERPAHYERIPQTTRFRRGRNSYNNFLAIKVSWKPEYYDNVHLEKQQVSWLDRYRSFKYFNALSKLFMKLSLTVQQQILQIERKVHSVLSTELDPYMINEVKTYLEKGPLSYTVNKRMFISSLLMLEVDGELVNAKDVDEEPSWLITNSMVKDKTDPLLLRFVLRDEVTDRFYYSELWRLDIKSFECTYATCECCSNRWYKDVHYV